MASPAQHRESVELRPLSVPAELPVAAADPQETRFPGSGCPVQSGL